MIRFKRINAICCIVISTVIFLTACSFGSKEGVNSSNDGTSANAVQKSGWIYVPEMVEIGDKRADYGNMQLIGDTACYISVKGDSEGEEFSISKVPEINFEKRQFAETITDFPAVNVICTQSGEQYDFLMSGDITRN